MVTCPACSDGRTFVEDIVTGYRRRPSFLGLWSARCVGAGHDGLAAHLGVLPQTGLPGGRSRQDARRTKTLARTQGSYAFRPKENPGQRHYFAILRSTVLLGA